MNQPMFGLNSRSLLLSGLIAGIGIGLLSNIPLIACVNCLLLAWVWGGGIGAVYLYRRYENRPPLTLTQGLVIGAVAGAIGAVIGGVASLLLGSLSAAFTTVLNNLAGENGTTIPSYLLNSGFSLLGALFNIILYGIFGAIGGLIATGLIWKAPVLPMPRPPSYTPPGPAGN
jgi:hypothetical protein